MQNHMRVISHLGAVLNAKNTLKCGNSASISRVYFDQGLVSLVEAQESYSKNTRNFTTYTDDDTLAEEDVEVDPIFNLVLVGDSVSCGMFASIAFEIDIASSYCLSPAVSYTFVGDITDEDCDSIVGVLLQTALLSPVVITHALATCSRYYASCRALLSHQRLQLTNEIVKRVQVIWCAIKSLA